MANDFIETNYDDDVAITLGTTTAFKIKYDSGDTRLEILDGADNVMAHIEDDGTTGTLTMTGGLAIPTGAITSGTYTPTWTNVANATTTTGHTAQYIRVGNVVTVSGGVDITPTANSTLTRSRCSLPIASNFANAFEAGGGGANVTTAPVGQAVLCFADTTNDEVELRFLSDAAAAGVSRIIYYSFTYQII
jgi:hypothetical protein